MFKGLPRRARDRAARLGCSSAPTWRIPTTCGADEARGFAARRRSTSTTGTSVNWLDPVVERQGDTPEQQVKNRKLRQALSIAIDWEEGYGRITATRRRGGAHGPVPPGVFARASSRPRASTR